MGVYLVSQLLNGLIFGLIYCLIALGLTVVFSIMRVINFAHGEFFMLGGYALYGRRLGAARAVRSPSVGPRQWASISSRSC